MFQQEGEGSLSTRVCAVFLYLRWNNQVPFDIVPYAYTPLLWDNRSQNSCIEIRKIEV